MIVLEVLVDGKPFARAGRADLSVLVANVTAVGILGPNSRGTVHRKEGFELSLQVGGLGRNHDRTEDEHVDWGEMLALQVGSVVTVRLLESENADEGVARPDICCGPPGDGDE